MAMEAPLAASCWAMPAPMPRAPPVIRATLPERGPDGVEEMEGGVSVVVIFGWRG